MKKQNYKIIDLRQGFEFLIDIFEGKSKVNKKVRNKVIDKMIEQLNLRRVK